MIIDEGQVKSNILFVDDDENVHAGLKRLLARHRKEWDISFASNAQEALEKFKRAALDTIVLDINMPGQSGFELLAELRQREEGRDIPIIMLTGMRDDDLKRRALNSGADDLLCKPVNREDLVARLKSMLRIKRFQDEMRNRNKQLNVQVHERSVQLKKAQIEIVWRLGKAAEYRDEETGYHIIRVAHYTAVLADRIGLPQDTVNMLFITSPLHDVGKIGTPDHILLKKGKLTGEEWATMKQHTIIGAQILSPDLIERQAMNLSPESMIDQEITSGSSANPFLEMASRIAKSHHEWWDGSGYPRGLGAEEIPLPGRIVALADVYDALASDRPYKKAFPEEKALAIMQEESDRHFDPEIYKAFLDCIEEFRTIRNRWRD